MLNKDNQRELAYVVKIDDIQPIPASDNCEAAVVNGWTVMVRKDTFKPNDYAIYFEIDSKVPAVPPFMFLEKKNFSIKTQIYTFGGKTKFYSQGLIMAFDDFIIDGKKPEWLIDLENQQKKGKDISNTFLTKELSVTYADPADNKRKGNGEVKKVDNVQKILNKCPKMAKNKTFRAFVRTRFGQKIVSLFLKSKESPSAFPYWVRKTDEERIENLPQYFTAPPAETWLATEKIDGMSSTYTIHREKHNKLKFYICSRNRTIAGDVVKESSSIPYIKIAKKYNIEAVLTDLMNKNPTAKYITLQGEIYGKNIQKNDYSLNEIDFAAFNLIVGMADEKADGVRKGTKEMVEILKEYDIPSVPILNDEYKLPTSLEELRAYVNSEPSVINGKIKEGIVFRSPSGNISFKCVSPEYLIKYHQ